MNAAIRPEAAPSRRYDWRRFLSCAVQAGLIEIDSTPTRAARRAAVTLRSIGVATDGRSSPSASHTSGPTS